MPKPHDSRPYSRELSRIADALERLCDHFCPTEPHRNRRPATIGTATYRRPDDTPEAWAEVEASGKRPLPVNAQIRRDG